VRTGQRPVRSKAISDIVAIRTAVGEYARDAKAARGETSLVAWAELELAELIDRGSMGYVYRARWRGKDVAVKLLGPPLSAERAESEVTAAAAGEGAAAAAMASEAAAAPREVRQLLAECRLMLSLGAHPHVAALLGVASDMRARHGVVMELMHTSLRHLLESRRPTAGPGLNGEKWAGAREEGRAEGRAGLRWWPTLQRIAVEVARGMAYLHEHHILHRDLKPANVLLSPPPGLVAKVSDFGESRQHAERCASMTLTAGKGTPAFMAPEVLRQERYGTEADVFSYGSLLVNMATREAPYTQLLKSTPPMKVMMLVAEGAISPLSSIGGLSPDWPLEVAALAERCVLDDREARPSFEVVAEQLSSMMAEDTAANSAWLPG